MQHCNTALVRGGQSQVISVQNTAFYLEYNMVFRMSVHASLSLLSMFSGDG